MRLGSYHARTYGDQYGIKTFVREKGRKRKGEKGMGRRRRGEGEGEKEKGRRRRGKMSGRGGEGGGYAWMLHCTEG